MTVYVCAVCVCDQRPIILMHATTFGNFGERARARVGAIDRTRDFPEKFLCHFERWNDNKSNNNKKKRHVNCKANGRFDKNNSNHNWLL